MNKPIPLVHVGSDGPAAWMCPECKSVWLLGDRIGASSCCPSPCSKDGCTAKVTTGGEWCETHWQGHVADLERRRFEKAKKVTPQEYSGGPVHWPGHEGSMGDGYFADVEEVWDYCSDMAIDVPGYVWGCEEIRPRTRASALIDSALEEHHEDAAGAITDAMETDLQAFLDGWWQRTGITSWKRDASVAVMLPKEPVL